MDITVITNYPEKFTVFDQGIVARALKNKTITLNFVSIFDVVKKHNLYAADDRPYGGGAGMILSPTIFDLLDKEINLKAFDYRWYMSPRGAVWSQNYACHYSAKLDKKICILCGLYEGVDQRILEYYQFSEISVGDYILCGGELPAMIVIESLTRLLPGVIKSESMEQESFMTGFLEHDLYTRPKIWRTYQVPSVLLSGHHKNIQKWRYQNSMYNTKFKRPDLWKNHIIMQLVINTYKILV